MRLEMVRQPIQHRLDLGLVPARRRRCAQPLQPGVALRVVAEQ